MSEQSARRRAAGTLLLLAAAAAVVSLALLVWSLWGLRHAFGLLDLSVYRDGSGDVLHSGDLYQDRFGSHPLPFTYPPVAAIALMPLRLLRLDQAGPLWTAVSLGFLLWMIYIAHTSGSAGQREPRSVWAGVLVLFAASLWLEPVQSTFSLGQINLILDGLILIDLCGGMGRVPRGVLVGVAAAIKLVPLFFILYLLAVGRTRAALTASATFVAVTAVGWVLAPDASRQYWTRVVLNTDRVGSPQYVANQSLHGVIVRLMGADHSAAGTLLWVGAAAATTVWGLVLAARLYARCGPLPGALAAACTSLLVAPISWSHYYVWIAPIAALMVTARWELPTPWRVGGLGCVLVFVAGPIWWLPHGHDAELRYTVPQQVLAASYVIATLLLMAGAQLWTVRRAAWTDGTGHRGATVAEVGAR
jgi:alpha-1,2-mannosyltransferase